MKTGAAIKRARKEKGWSQKKLAKEMCVARETVTHWEMGQYPILICRRELRRVLGVELDNE